VPPGTRTKDLKVELTNSKLSVGIKGHPPLLAGDLHKRILADQSFWTLEDNKEVLSSVGLSLQRPWFWLSLLHALMFCEQSLLLFSFSGPVSF
jgi:hypothetical protein